MGKQPQQRMGGGQQPGRSRGNVNRPAGGTEVISPAISDIDLINLGPDLFDGKAKAIADALRQGGKNSTTQIRKFYNEMLRYEVELREVDDQSTFDKRLPFLRMLNARAAYAKERGHVDQQFAAFLKTMLHQVRDYPTLRNACTLFEAVIGFSPKR